MATGMATSWLLQPTAETHQIKRKALGKSSYFRQLNEKLLEVRVTLIPDNTGTDLEVAGNFLQSPPSKTFKHVLT